MTLFAIISALIVALEHVYILVLEMFMSQTKRAARAFEIDIEFLKKKEAKVMMANQGLYNGFLAAGIVFGLFIVPANAQLLVTLFFLLCVIIAALYGAFTASRRILIIQGLPVIIAFTLCVFFL